MQFDALAGKLAAIGADSERRSILPAKLSAEQRRRDHGQPSGRGLVDFMRNAGGVSRGGDEDPRRVVESGQITNVTRDTDRARIREPADLLRMVNAGDG